MTKTEQNTEKNWLIKSSTRILGPFDFSEVAELLKSRQVSVIDEIRLPQGRWSYIRENALFLEIVKNIRDEQDTVAENTMTQSVAQYTQTKTDHLPDELTPTPTPHFDSSFPGRNIKDVTPSAHSPATIGSSTPARSYGSSGDSRVQGRLKEKSNHLRWALLSIAIVVVGLVTFSISQKDKNKAVGHDELMSQALRYKSMGLYEKALQSFTKGSKLKIPSEDLKVQMAPVLISEDRQSLLGRRILEGALSQDGMSRSQIVEAYLGIAVSYMMDGDLKQGEDTLNKAIGYEPFNLSALLNLAIIELKKGQFHKAMEDFSAIVKRHPDSMLALFGQAIASIEYARGTSDFASLKKLMADIKENIKTTGYLREELSLILVYASSLLGDVDTLNQAVVHFLGQVPGQAKFYTHPLLVDWRFTQWDYLEKYCAELYQKQTPHAELKALRAVCLMELNRDTDADKFIQEAVAEAPKDPYVLIVQASFLNKMGRIQEAMAVLNMPELKPLNVRNLLLGSMCFEAHDVICVNKTYGEVYRQNKQNAMVLHGLAWSALQTKNRTGAYDYVRAGLQAEPNYIPLLELREQLESE